MIRFARLPRDAHFRRGAREMLAFGPGLAAWGLVTGVAMTQSRPRRRPVAADDLHRLRRPAPSSPRCRSSQRGADLGHLGIAFCVNLRFVIFSSQWRVHLGHCRAAGACCSATCSPT
jgi:hypothetical protein